MASGSVVLATGGFDQKIRLWEATSGICSKTLRFNESQINCIDISRDKHLIIAGGSQSIQLFDIHAGNEAPLLSCEGHTSNVTSIGFQLDGKWFYSCSEDGTIKIWDMRSPHFHTNINLQCGLNDARLCPNQTDIITGDQQGAIKVIDLLKTTCRTDFTPLAETPIRSISVAKNSSFMTAASHRGKVYVYKPNESKEWELNSNFQAHSAYLLKCVIAPDTKSVITTSADHSIKLWDTNTWALSKHMNQHHQKWVWDAAYSGDSSFIVSASSDSTAKLWDLRTGDVLRNYAGHNLTVTCVALNDSQDV